MSDAVATADGVRSGRVRARDVMTAALEAITVLNPEVNAFVTVADPLHLIACAAEVDRRVEAGEDPGPLAGVPVGVKDLEDVAGLPTSNGSMSCGDEPAEEDSRLVARLRSAGAIPVGKTNTPEFGYSIDTRNRRFGPTRNPLDPARSPGGSSGGSAAAVAAGMVPLATGSDGGGSIRIPAAFCRLPGLKPTAGLIPDGGEDTWGGLSVLGALTRSVRDIARFLDVVAERPPHRPLEDSLKEPFALEDLRAMVSVDLHGATIDRGVAEGFLKAMDDLVAAGLAVERRESPLPSSLETFSVIASYGDAQRLKGLSQEELSKMSRGYLAWCESGAALTADDLAAASADRGRLGTIVDDLFEHADLILSPTVGVLPWRLEDRSSLDPLKVMLTHPFNLTGHPAISIPLPGRLAGLQAAGALGSEALLLRFAEAALAALGDGKEL